MSLKILKKITAGIFLTIGLSILLIGTIDLVNPNATQKNKEGSLAAIVLFSLPSTTIGTWLVWSLRQQHLQQLKKLNLAKEQLFLRLLQQQEGKITVTEFALAAQITLEEAKLYLDRKAILLNADFESSNQGGMIYKFTI